MHRLVLPRFFMALIALCCVAPIAWAEETMARLSDKDIKALAKTLQEQERSFDRALDSKFRRSILRGPGGEIDVDNYLDDLEEAIDRLRKRFTGEYSASTEATEVLQRASFMNGYVHDNPDVKGANEWDVFGSSLQRLAAAYGTEFPLPEGAQVRRVGDGELADAATAIAKLSKEVDNVLRKSTRKIPELKEPVEKGREDLESMAETAKTLSSRIHSGKPASAEARQLVESEERIDGLVATPGMPEAVVDAWHAGESYFGKIHQAFGI